MPQKYQVVIVGGGPVGVALAVELGLRDVSCALVERHLEPQRIPKGQNLSQRTLEHFYFWSIADELRAARIMPPGFPASGIVAYRSLMSDWWAAPPQREIVRQYYFQDNERLPQYETEAVLRRKMATLPSVHAMFGWLAESVEQDDRSARVTISERNGSGRQVLEADYVVGCDGGRSKVREAIGIERGGAEYDQMMMLAVFRSRELHEGLKRFPGRSTYNVLHPDMKGYWQFFGRIDVGEGWFFHAPVPQSAAKGDYDFRGLLHKAAGFEFACELDHVGFWDLRVAVADRYQRGRVFIAGDAAHSHPPYGGFGLNSGLEDAKNLGWKLAATLQGWGGETLLASYTDERRPIFREIGDDFIGARIEDDREFLDHYSPERDRDEFEREWNDRMKGVGGRALSYEPHYEGSVVVMGAEGAVCSAHGEHMYEARVGHHLQPQPLSSGRNVYEELGNGFTLLAFGVGDEPVRAFEQAARSLNVPLKILRDNYEAERKRYEAQLILVRPDQYVVSAGNDAPRDAAGMLKRVTGR